MSKYIPQKKGQGEMSRLPSQYPSAKNENIKWGLVAFALVILLGLVILLLTGLFSRSDKETSTEKQQTNQFY